MATNLKKTVKIDTDKKTGKTKVSRVYAYDVSATRKIAKQKQAKDGKGRVASRAKARAAR